MDIVTLQTDVESVSLGYAERNGIDRTDDWLMLKLGEEVGELTQAYLSRSGQARDRGRSASQLDDDFRAEMADVLAHVLLLAQRFEVDMVAQIEHKRHVWKPSQ